MGQEEEEAALQEQRAHQMKTAELLRAGISPDVWMHWTKEKSEYILLSILRYRDSAADSIHSLSKTGALRYTWSLN